MIDSVLASGRVGGELRRCRRCLSRRAQHRRDGEEQQHQRDGQVGDGHGPMPTATRLTAHRHPQRLLQRPLVRRSNYHTHEHHRQKAGKDDPAKSPRHVAGVGAQLAEHGFYSAPASASLLVVSLPLRGVN